jgi:hypothetical protein
VLAEHFWIWRDLAPNAVDEMKLINESIEKWNPMITLDLPTGIYTDSFMVDAMTKPRTKNKQ